MKGWKKTFKVAAVLLAVLMVVGFVPTSVGAHGGGGGDDYSITERGYWVNSSGKWLKPNGDVTNNKNNALKLYEDKTTYQQGGWKTVNANSVSGYSVYGNSSENVYLDRNDKKKDVDFKYTVDTQSYTVHYYLQGTTTKVKDDKTGSGVTNQTVTENAAIISGYTRVGPSSQSLKLGAGSNEITFYYKADNQNYTVHYYLQGTTTSLATNKSGSGVTGQVITESAVDITGYTLVGNASQNLTLAAGTNKIIFYYTANAQSYTVHYYLQGTTTSLLTDKTGSGVTAQVINETAETIPGYTLVGDASQSLTLTAGTNEITFYYTADPQTYTVKYLEQGSNDVLSAEKPGSGVTGQEVSESAIDITGYTLAGDASKNLTLTTGTNEIIFYYTANEQTYTVNYLEKGTDKVLAPSKTADTFFDEVIDPESEIISIPGYYYAGASVESLTVGTDNAENVINIYYKGEKVPYVVQHLVHVEFYGKEFDIPVVPPDAGIGRVGKTATGYAKDIPGLTPVQESDSITLAWGEPNIIKIYYTRNMQEYTVNFYKEGTTEPVRESVTKEALVGTWITPLDEYVDVPGYDIVDSDPCLIFFVGPYNECNVINIYYAPAEQTYTVNYLDKDTGDPIETEKTGTGIFGDVITSADEVIDIEGYTYDSADVETLTLGADDTANVINLYYASATVVVPTEEPPLGPVETTAPTKAPADDVVIVPEESVPAALPITGEASLDWMFLAGAIVLATGTLLLVFRKRKQGEK